MSLLNKLRSNNQQDVQGIDMSPLLDVVFILLIFFIVSTVFVQETGVEVDKPQAFTAQQLEQTSIFIAITNQGSVIYDGTNIGVRGVRPTVEQLLNKKQRPVVIEADKTVPAELLIDVIDQAKLAGSETVSIASKVK